MLLSILVFSFLLFSSASEIPDFRKGCKGVKWKTKNNTFYIYDIRINENLGEPKCVYTEEFRVASGELVANVSAKIGNKVSITVFEVNDSENTIIAAIDAIYKQDGVQNIHIDVKGSGKNGYVSFV